MPTKQEILDTIFDQILDAIRAEVAPEVTSKISSLRSSPILNPGVPRMAAKDFTFMEAVRAFGLKYSKEMVKVRGGGLRLPRWRIGAIPETKGFVPTPCLRSLFLNYHRNFDRSSKAVCRIALDFILNECLMVMKGNHMEDHGANIDEADYPESDDSESDDADIEIQVLNPETDKRSKTPSAFKEIAVFGDVRFSHTITRPANGKSGGSHPGTVVNGRVDHSIGRILPSYCGDSATIRPKRLFQSLLLIVEAKSALNLDSALPQLVVYLASLHQSRVQRNRSDATVFGVVSDGYSFIFVTITHGGELKQSRRFEITEKRGMVKVLGCMKYMLETSAKMSNMTPEAEDQSEGDPDIDIDGNERALRTGTLRRPVTQDSL